MDDGQRDDRYFHAELLRLFIEPLEETSCTGIMGLRRAADESDHKGFPGDAKDGVPHFIAESDPQPAQKWIAALEPMQPVDAPPLVDIDPDQGHGMWVLISKDVLKCFRNTDQIPVARPKIDLGELRLLIRLHKLILTRRLGACFSLLTHPERYNIHDRNNLQ